MDSKPRLSQGPPKVTAEVHFSPRELEFIELRYGQALSMKEIAERMGVAKRTIAHFSNIMLLKLNIAATGGRDAPHIITITKFLVKNGFITL
jgi:predicted DNA-binding protein (UPF0251 family)